MARDDFDASSEVVASTPLGAQGHPLEGRAHREGFSFQLTQIQELTMDQIVMVLVFLPRRTDWALYFIFYAIDSFVRLQDGLPRYMLRSFCSFWVGQGALRPGEFWPGCSQLQSGSHYA